MSEQDYYYAVDTTFWTGVEYVLLALATVAIVAFGIKFLWAIIKRRD